MGEEKIKPSPSLLKFYEEECPKQYPLESLQTVFFITQKVAELIEKKVNKGTEGDEIVKINRIGEINEKTK